MTLSDRNERCHSTDIFRMSSEKESEKETGPERAMENIFILSFSAVFDISVLLIYRFWYCVENKLSNSNCFSMCYFNEQQVQNISLHFDLYRPFETITFRCYSEERKKSWNISE